MSVSKWAYEPEKCDGSFCIGDCYRCPKAIDGEHFPIEVAMMMLRIACKERLDELRREQGVDDGEGN